MSHPRSRTIIVPILLGVCVVLAVLLWRSVDAQARLRLELETLKSVIQPTLTIRQVAPVSPTPERSDPPKVAPLPAVLPITGGQTQGAPTGRTLALGERAEINQLMFLRSRWANLAKNEDAIALVDLPPDKKAKLRDLLVARNEAERDTRDIATAQKLSPEERAAALKAVLKKSEEDIERWLGPEDYRKYRQGLRESSFKIGYMESRELQGTFIDAGVALTRGQLEQLAQTFYEENKKAEDANLPSSYQPELHATILTKAAVYLNPAQAEALKRYFAADRRLDELVQQTGK